MRTSFLLAMWMLCAFAMATLVPQPQLVTTAHAAPKKPRKSKKSIRQCMTFSQAMAPDDEGVELTLRSGCQVDVVCSLEWELTCTSDGEPSANTPQKETRSLAFAEEFTASASASACDEDWQLDNVRWHCTPAP